MSDEELSSIGSSYDSTVNSIDISIKKQCGVYYKQLCHMRSVKNKGAILVIILSYLVSSTYYNIIYTISNQSSTIAYHLLFAVIGLTLPIAGCLADVRFGRYKVLSYSLWIMWISSVLLTITAVVAEVVNFMHKDIVVVTLLIPLGIGCGGFQANIIPFGIDQLTDASTNEIKSFIVWYVWTSITSGLLMCLISACSIYALLTPMLGCCFLTLALGFNLILNNHFIKEPTTYNPFKLVYGVLRYAIKNKHPRQRSAFTYCEDTIPSRIDFGKCKYGGPFTTEQVENVKTLFRIVFILLIGCAFYSVTVEWHFIVSKPGSLYTNYTSKQPFGKCSFELFFTSFYFISGSLLVPVHELLIYPLLPCCLSNFKSHYKLFIGVILCIAKFIVLSTLLTVSRVYYYSSNLNSNATLHCLFYEPNGVFSSVIDHRWTSLSEFLRVASDVMIYTGTAEFLTAQVPYSMRGLVVGITFGLLALYIPVFNTVEVIYQKISWNWPTGPISCGFWYFLTKLSIFLILTVMLFIALKCYKKRKREDVLPNEQVFAERYYSMTH